MPLPDWRKYVQACYDQLHHEHVTVEQLKQRFAKMPLTPGMDRVFNYIRTNNYDAAIISDSNSLQIEWVLQAHGWNSLFKWVVTNRARVLDGRVVIQNYTEKCDCDVCADHMCKNEALRNDIPYQHYDTLCYFGDGFNDFCPSSLLR